MWKLFWNGMEMDVTFFAMEWKWMSRLKRILAWNENDFRMGMVKI